jgi:oligopeptidase A
MENWCYHQETLLGMAKHFETGETLPMDLYHKLYDSRSFRAGMLTLRQLTFGLTDLALHMKDNPSIRDIEQDIAKKTAIIPPLPEDRSLCSFSHIFAGGYAAGYYSYFWAEVLSADAFEAFEEVGLSNKEAIAKVGTRFKETVLGLGGSRNPTEIYKMFRGREATPHALLRQKNLVS